MLRVSRRFEVKPALRANRMSLSIRRALSAVTFASILTWVFASAAASSQLTIYRGMTLIDGTGAAPTMDMSIVVEGERIRAVVSDTQASQYASDANVIDAHGLYALPGLIDSHVHMATSPNRRFAEALLRRDVYSGITTVRDMAGDGRQLADLSRAARMAEMPSPDIYYAALMAGPEFFKDPRTHEAAKGAVAGEVPWMRAITADTDMTLAVAEAHGTGATAIKIYADLPEVLVQRITAEAHRQNMLVWAHATVFPASPRQVVDAGVDIVSHSCLLGYQVSDPIPRAYHDRAPVDAAKLAGDNPEIDSLLADMKSRGTVLDATLTVYDTMSRVPNPKTPPYCSAALAEKLTDEAHRAGIPISTGTDDPGEWNDPWPSLFGELSLLVHHAGFTPMEALVASSRVGAMTVGKTAETGTIEAGKLANLMFVAKNPLDDIDNLETVTMTVKRGALYRRSDYRPITKDEAQGEM
jgi:imidazolonepropionase-like amidohydrolase